VARPLPLVASCAAFAAGFGLPFVFALRAWPEIVVPAYFVTRGGVLYDTIFFIHTPLLILTTAAGGALFGFSAALFRVIVGIVLGACAAMIVVAVRPGRPLGFRYGFLAGLPFFVLSLVYGEEPALAADPLVAVFFLAGALLLERFERRSDRWPATAAGLTFGIAIVVKQTCAWAALAALIWMLLTPRRRASMPIFLAMLVAPYAIFVAGWAIAYRTWSHVRWTLLLPVLTRHYSEIGIRPTAGEIAGALAFYVVIPAFLLIRMVAPRFSRLRTPAPWIAVGAIGMAFPRWEVTHVNGGFPLLALLFARACLLAPAAIRRFMKSPSPQTGSGLVALVAVTVAMIVVCAPLIPFSIAHTVLYWDDSVTQRTVNDIESHVRPGSRLLIFNTPFETAYVRTGTITPDGSYVNPVFWYYLDKFGVGERVVAALRRHPETPILFRDLGPDDDARARDSIVYRYIAAHTRAVAPAVNGATWRFSTR